MVAIDPKAKKAPPKSNVKPWDYNPRAVSQPVTNPAPPSRQPASKNPDSPSAGAHAPLPDASESVPTDPRAFQEYLNRRGAGLVVDGVVGPKTLAAAARLNVPVPQNLAPAARPAAAAPAANDEPAAAPPAPAPAHLTAGQIQQTMREQYGYLGLLLDIPDVNQVLTESIANERTPAQTLAALYDTGTWKNTQASVRNWMALSGTDPASAQAQIAAQKTAIQQTAATLGVPLAEDRLSQIATDSLKLGWTAQQINAAIGAEFQYKPGSQVGKVGAAENVIKQMAADYLVPISDATLADWDRQVAMGTATPDTFKQYMVTQAKGLFPTLQKQLDAGLTVQQLAEPYRQAAAQELDISPDSIDFKDAKWMRALSTTGPDGQPVMMGLADWQKTLRTDEQYGWDRTKNGIAAGYRVGNALSQALGLRA